MTQVEPRRGSAASTTKRSRRLAWSLAGIGPVVLFPLWILAASELKSVGFLASFAGSVLLMVLLISSYSDLRFNRIPNWLTYSGLLWALAINVTAPWFSPTSGEQIQLPAAVAVDWPSGAVGAGSSLLGAFVCFAVMFLIYRLAGGGAGDVKLATVIGAFLGPGLGYRAILASYIFAAALIIAWTVWERGLFKLTGAFGRRIGSVILPVWITAPTEEDDRTLNTKMPLAPAFSFGTIVALYWGGAL